jgi:acyl carrier protein
MVPSVFIPLSVLPLTDNGKVDRRRLPPPIPDQAAWEVNYAAPRTPMEVMLVGIWREVLGLDQIGIHQNFFDLGGHSLIATQVISRVREVLQLEIPLHVLFDAPTVAELALAIAHQLAEQENAEKVKQILAEIEQLSSKDLQHLLGHELDQPQGDYQ